MNRKEIMTQLSMSSSLSSWGFVSFWGSPGICLQQAFSAVGTPGAGYTDQQVPGGHMEGSRLSNWNSSLWLWYVKKPASLWPHCRKKRRERESKKDRERASARARDRERERFPASIGAQWQHHHMWAARGTEILLDGRPGQKDLFPGCSVRGVHCVDGNFSSTSSERTHLPLWTLQASAFFLYLVLK